MNLGKSTRADMSVRSEQVRVTEPAKLVTTSGDVARRAQQRFAFRRVSQQGKRKRGSCVLQGARGIGSTVMDVGECACVRINKAIEDVAEDQISQYGECQIGAQTLQVIET